MQEKKIELFRALEVVEIQIRTQHSTQGYISYDYQSCN